MQGICIIELLYAEEYLLFITIYLVIKSYEFVSNTIWQTTDVSSIFELDKKSDLLNIYGLSFLTLFFSH